MLELLETQGPYTLRRFVERLEEEVADDDKGKKSHLAIVSDPAYAAMRKFLDDTGCPEHPKLEETRRIASEQVMSHPNSRLLIFTQYRDTASRIVDELNKVSGVRAERFVGQASKLRDKGLSQEKQASLIEDLRKGYINALCSTSIAEEGLDIPEVDLVIFYEPVPSEIRYIQRRGRTGRKSPGRVVILATEGTTDQAYLQASERRTERMKGIVSSLNDRLRPVLRLVDRPPRMPMTEEQLRGIEATRPTSTLIGLQAREQEEARRIARIVARAEHDVFMAVLQIGEAGFDQGSLFSQMEEEKGYPREIVAAALRRLEKAKHLHLPPRTPRGARDDSERKTISVAVQSIPGAKVMMVEVEKVLQGGAIVLIDDRFRARLESTNYSGPRDLIRKGKKFKAVCEIYESSGDLNLNVRQVVQAV